MEPGVGVCALFAKICLQAPPVPPRIRPHTASFSVHRDSRSVTRWRRMFRRTTSEGGTMRIRVALMLGAFLATVTSVTVFGQGFQGGLRGSVKDSGGVIPGVEVTLTNERTNISRNTTTNERGEYVFTNVDPGSFTVKAAL